eukprot:3898689-Amphidinium_carterae.1
MHVSICSGLAASMAPRRIPKGFYTPAYLRINADAHARDTPRVRPSSAEPAQEALTGHTAESLAQTPERKRRADAPL